MKLWQSSVKRLYDKRIHPDMQRVIEAVVADWPFPMWEIQVNRYGGFRTPETQKALYYEEPVGSRTKSPDKSMHMKGLALDLTLYWRGTEKAIWDRYSYTVVAGYIFGIASQFGIKLRWGADWNQNWIIKEEDNWEVDFVHWERG